jgi:hypothetical protein
MLPACVSVHAPLTADATYPSDWIAPQPLGDECHGIAGTYRNPGVLLDSGGHATPVLLTELLAVAGAPATVALAARTTRRDQHGDTFATLEVRLGDTAAAPHTLTSCYCLTQTLACTQIAMKTWALPVLGFGGSQRNLYLARTTDGALIGRLQEYRADVVVAVPVFSKDEPWVRFAPAGSTQ